MARGQRRWWEAKSTDGRRGGLSESSDTDHYHTCPSTSTSRERERAEALMKRSNHLSRIAVYPVCRTRYDTVLFASRYAFTAHSGECSTGRERTGHGACPVFADPNRFSGTDSIICNEIVIHSITLECWNRRSPSILFKTTILRRASCEDARVITDVREA